MKTYKHKFKERVETVTYVEKEVEVPVCQGRFCDGAPIMNEKDGFVIRGGIYLANKDGAGGILGQPTHTETAYCKRCFIEALFGSDMELVDSAEYQMLQQRLARLQGQNLRY